MSCSQTDTKAHIKDIKLQMHMHELSWQPAKYIWNDSRKDFNSLLL